MRKLSEVPLALMPFYLLGAAMHSAVDYVDEKDLEKSIYDERGISWVHFKPKYEKIIEDGDLHLLTKDEREQLDLVILDQGFDYIFPKAWAILSKELIYAKASIRNSPSHNHHRGSCTNDRLNP